MNLEVMQKLLHAEPGAVFLGIEPKSATAMSEYVGVLHRMLLASEECSLTIAELRALLIRLWPNAEAVMKSSVSIPRVLTSVAEELFIRGSGDPADVAAFRYVLKQFRKTGKLPVVD